MSLMQVPFMSQECDFLPVGERIKVCRGALTQAAFADRLGVARKTVTRWESGEVLPDGASLLALLREFAVDPAYLLMGRQEAPAMLTKEEQHLLVLFRLADAGIRKAVLGALSAGAGASGASVVVHGDVGQQVAGGVHAPQTINMRGGRTRR